MISPTFDQEMLARNYWETLENSHNVGKTRHRRNVLYRHAFMVACREVSQLSLMSIGRILNKDHATVLHAIRSHEANYRFDNQYRSIYTEIHTCLGDLISENAEAVYEVVKKKALSINPDIFNDHMIVMYKQKIEQQEKEYKERNEVLQDTVKKLKRHNKQQQKRIDELNTECLRLKNLL